MYRTGSASLQLRYLILAVLNLRIFLSDLLSSDLLHIPPYPIHILITFLAYLDFSTDHPFQSCLSYYYSLYSPYINLLSSFTLCPPLFIYKAFSEFLVCFIVAILLTNVAIIRSAFLPHIWRSWFRFSAWR